MSHIMLLRPVTAYPATLILLLTACGSTASPDTRASAASDDTQPYSGIGPGEIVHFTGTEPFWGGQVSGSSLTYSTPDDQRGTTIAVSRFAGRNGLSFSGELDAMPFVLAITPGKCSDGMSDRAYLFAATLLVHGEQRDGCAWTDKQPFNGGGQP